ncbi:MAG: hypothetical protein KIIPBIDF_00975 [Candidatus Methanoperedenaceae archaeon GB50]|nr:MAG: hypothetical protein KIIPBIDF_00975 [Candidatus Methanoperedenaceae archaeon GB50]
MLAPVAVSTEHQRKGIGQALINYGLDELKKRSVSIVVTYGDPSFYSADFVKIGAGFRQSNFNRDPNVKRNGSMQNAN